MAFFPVCKPIEYPGTVQLVQAFPTRPVTKVLLAGDMTVNPDIWVRQVLAAGRKACGRCANVALKRWTFQQMVDVRFEGTGKKRIFAEISPETAVQLHGVVGAKLALQMKYGKACDPWEVTDDFISVEELGINPNEVVGFQGTIEGSKASGFWS